MKTGVQNILNSLDSGFRRNDRQKHSEGFCKRLKYYEIVGWDIATGIPTEKRLKELGIEMVRGEIY